MKGLMAYRLQKCCLVSLCLLWVLCVDISLSQARDPQIDKCYSYYEQILDIQDRRKMFQDGLDVLFDLYAQGKLSKNELDNTVALWHTVETSLRAEVTSLYDIAYTEGCFDESLRTKTRDAPEI